MLLHFSEDVNNHSEPFALSTFAKNKGTGLTFFAQNQPCEPSSFAQNGGNSYEASFSVDEKCCTAHDGHGKGGQNSTKCWPDGVTGVVLAARSRLYKEERGKSCDEDASVFPYSLLAKSLGSRFRSSVTGKRSRRVSSI